MHTNFYFFLLKNWIDVLFDGDQNDNEANTFTTPFSLTSNELLSSLFSDQVLWRRWVSFR